MAGNKYQTLVNGRETLIAGTQVSAGAADANKIPALDSTGKLDLTLMPTGVGPGVKVLPCTENLPQGRFINIYDNAGTPSCRLADSTLDRPAHGFIKDAFTNGSNATVYFEGLNVDLTGMTAGAKLFLGAAGQATMTVPALPTDVIHQFLGKAISATEMDVEMDDEVVL